MKKLYVITRKDLGIVYAGVQAGHGVAQWVLEHPVSDWRNSTLIYLAVETLDELIEWKKKLLRLNLESSLFHEHDIGDKLTAIACYSDGKKFKKLKLLM